MKIIKIFIVLILLAAPVMAEKNRDVVTIGEFDSTLQGFSFTSGGIVKVDEEAESLPIKIDFIFDLPNGLGMNNSALDSWFPGEGMVQDLGNIPLEKNVDFIDDDFAPYLIPDEIIAGHTYLMKLAGSDKYGRIKIIDFDEDNSRLTFKWVYLDE
ncbi:MAG: hypothetical protein JEZ04_09700 [Spirochaetales bacterium]|nr:hypothetical protein [Spirochaetales bacterium]